jgi:penicillin-binding protein 1A
MVGAYSTFVNEGVYTEPSFITRIEDKNGNVLQEFPPRTKEVLSEETAYLMLHMLQGTTSYFGEEYDRYGTAVGLSRWGVLGEGNEVGAKTGTTSNYSDGWFMGVTKDLVAGTWVGGDDRSIHFRTLALGQGGRMAMPIYGKFMEKVYVDPDLAITKGPFKRPDRGLTVEIDCERYQNQSAVESDSLQQIIEEEENAVDPGGIF